MKAPCPELCLWLRVYIGQVWNVFAEMCVYFPTPVGPAGAADELKTLNARFQESAPPPRKKLSPGESYNVEDLTITIGDPCDRAQHSVKTKAEEIKLKHAANQPVQLKTLISSQPKTSSGNRGRGRGHNREVNERGGYGQGTGPGIYGHGQQFPARGGYQQGHRGHMARGFDRYEAYTSGYNNYNDQYGQMYRGPQMPAYNPGPRFGPYGPTMPPFGPVGHGLPGGPGGYYADPYRGYQSQPPPLRPFGDPYLLTPAPALMQLPPINISPAPSTVMNRTAVNISAPHSPSISVADEKPEGQNCCVCEKIGHSRCGRCKVPYCSKECQKADWLRHKELCKDIKQGRDQAEEFERNFDVTVGDEMIQNVKGLVERYTGDQIEVTKKAAKSPLQKSTAKQPAKKIEKGQREAGTADIGNSQNKRQQTGRQTDKQDRDRDQSKQNDRKGAKNITCFNCGKTGHYKGECPNTDRKAQGREDHKSDQKAVNQSKAAPVEHNEPGEKPLAQSTPSSSTTTTPAKPVDKSSTSDRTHKLPTATLPHNTEVRVVVTEVVSPNMIWVQIVYKENVEPLQELMGKMAEKFSNSKPDLTTAREGQYCGVQFSLDQQWYRGKVISVQPNKDYIVQFIDFGNTEKRSLDDLRKIEEAWLQHPAQAIHCYIEDMSPLGIQTNYSDPADKYQAIITTNVPYRVTSKTQKEGEYGLAKYGVVMISEANENMADKLLAAGLVKKKQPLSTGLRQTEETSPVIMMKELGCLAKEMKVGQEIYMMITDAVSPANFTVHIIEDERIAAFKNFSEKLATVEKEPPYRPASVGELVVAKFSIDGSWYRGDVLKISDTQVELTYIDFGNSEAVELKNVRKSKSFCKSLPGQAMKCCLSRFQLPQNEELANKVLLAFVELVSLAAPVKLKAVVKSIKDDVVMLEVFSAQDNKSVNSELDSLSNTENESKRTEIPAGAVTESSVEPRQIDVKDIPEGQLPLDGTTVLATVTEMQSNVSFYVQPVDNSSMCKVQAIMNELNSKSNKGAVLADEIHVGDSVAAPFNDGASLLWYRTRVEEVISDKVKVLYVDYGNSDTVSNTSVKKLSPELMQYPAMAIHCELLGSEGPDPQVSEDFKCMLNQTLNVKAVLHRSNLYTVELVLPNEDAISVNTTLGLDISKLPDTSEEQQASPRGTVISAFPVLSLPMDGSKVSAVVMDVLRLDLFCIQLTEDKFRLQLGTLMNDLNESCQKNMKPYVPRDGECIAAQFNDGGSTLWYRAVSLVRDPAAKDKFRVQFVDYGNTDTATKEMMRVIEPQFIKVPAMAVKCKLKGCTGEESKEKIEEFKSVMYESVPLKIRALNLNVDVYEVEMFLDSDKVEKTDVSEILGLKQPPTEVERANIQPTAAVTKPKPTTPCQVAVQQVEFPLDGSTVSGVVVFIENLESFYVQQQDQELLQGLAQVMKELNESGVSTAKTYQPTLGEVVAAQYTDNGKTMWYRARVEKLDAGKIQVFFLDYGNTEHVKDEEVQRLDEKFLRLSQMAVKCRLPGCTGTEDPELLAGFSCILDQTLLVKALKHAGGVYVIDLITDNGLSISETLGLSLESSSSQSAVETTISEQEVAKVEKLRAVVQQEPESFKLPLDGSKVPAAVMAIDNLQCFYIQVLSEELQAELSRMMPELNHSCATAARPYTPAVGEIVAAQYTDGEEAIWYRARVNQVLGKTLEVTFVDYGKTEIVARNEICGLEDKFLKFRQAAVKCKLVGCTEDEDQQLVKDFELVLKVQLMVKAVDCSNGVYAIELLTKDGISINEKLGLTPAQGRSPQARSVSPMAVQAESSPKESSSPRQEALPRKSVSPQQGRTAERKVVFTQTLPRHIPEVKEFKLMMTSVTSPDLFHAQMMDLEHDYQTDLALQTHRMMLECESELGQEDISYEVGELCCAKYKTDNSWYRASILKVYPDKSAQVEFVDFGNTELVPLSMIRPITNDYVELPVLAFKCSLAGIYPSGGSWSNESSDKLKIFMSKLLSAVLVDVHKDVYALKLVEPESKADVGETLVNAGVASKTCREAAGGQAISPRAQPVSETGGETDRLQRENEIMRQQLKMMEAQMAELLKQKR